MLSGQDGAGDVPPTLWPIRRHGSQDRVPALKTLSSTDNEWRRDRQVQTVSYHMGGQWMNKQRLVLIITFSAFSTRTLAVFSLSGLITGRLGTLCRNLPSTAGATVDCNTETYRLIRFQYKLSVCVCVCVCVYLLCRCLSTHLAFVALLLISNSLFSSYTNCVQFCGSKDRQTDR